jgi:hypothetical protein
MSKEEEFKTYKAVVHLKHTGEEVVCDLLSINEAENHVTIKDPCKVHIVENEQGQTQMALAPWLMTTKENTIHIGMRDILFIADCRVEIADQHTSMFSAIIQPNKADSKLIL